MIGLLFVVVFPLQAWMRQRDDLHASEHRLTVIRKERQRLEREAAHLADPREVERLARELYGMVRPGEQAYAAVPGAADDHHHDDRPRRRHPVAAATRSRTLARMPEPDDVARVTALLGRVPRAEFTVAVRDAAGTPMVIRNAPFLADGTPLPTTYWLVDPSCRGRSRGSRPTAGCGPRRTRSIRTRSRPRTPATPPSATPRSTPTTGDPARSAASAGPGSG